MSVHDLRMQMLRIAKGNHRMPEKMKNLWEFFLGRVIKKVEVPEAMAKFVQFQKEKWEKR